MKDVKTLVDILRSPMVEEEAKKAAVVAVRDYLKHAEEILRELAWSNPNLLDESDAVAVPIVFASEQEKRITYTEPMMQTKSMNLSNAGYDNILNYRFDGEYQVDLKKYTDSKLFFDYIIEELRMRGFHILVNDVDRLGSNPDFVKIFNERYGGKSYILPVIPLNFDEYIQEQEDNDESENPYIGEFDEMITARRLAELFRELPKIEAAKNVAERYFCKVEEKFKKLIEENPKLSYQTEAIAVPISWMSFKDSEITRMDVYVILKSDDTQVFYDSCYPLHEVPHDYWDWMPYFTDSKVFMDNVLENLCQMGFEVNVDLRNMRIIPLVYIHETDSH